MRIKISLILLIVVTFLLAGCTDTEEQSKVSSSHSATVSYTEVDKAVSDNDMFSNRDFEVGYDEKECISIVLSGDTAACNSDKVTVKDNKIIITDEGSYLITGKLNNGMIIVEADSTDKPQLILDNAEVFSSESAALCVKEADKVFVTLADNSTNSLNSGEEYIGIDDNNIDGAVFSKQDITFNGNGKLEISSPVGHGIVCKDDLVFTSGNYSIKSASHGLDVNDSVRISNAEIEIHSGKDGIHIENSDNAEKGFLYYLSGVTNITAEGDGISTGLYAEFGGGKIDITAGGGSVNGTKLSSDNYGGFMGGRPGGYDLYSAYETGDEDSVSMKGIKAETELKITDTNITIDSADDSIHSNTSVIINSGELNLLSGDDAIHAEDKLTINGGAVDIKESYEGLEAVDIVINGGEIALVASDDGINAAGGTDESGFGGRDNGEFGGGRGGMGGPGGFGSSMNSDGSIIINDGNIYVQASGDGIDANGYIEINGGYIVVCGPTDGDTSVLDYDVSAEIKGGTFVGTGSHMMAQTFSYTENQGILALSVGNQDAKTNIAVRDSNGNVVLEYKPDLSFEIFLFSSPDIETGETYEVSIGEYKEEFTAS